MNAPVTIDAALRDAALLGGGLGDTATWGNWIAILKASFALSLAPPELAAFHKLAGGRPPPSSRVREAWFIVGRRSGKSRIAALIAVFLACFGKYSLSAGETGYVLALAASKSQAAVVFRYALGFLRASPILSQLIEEVTAEEIRLTNGIIISVHTASQRTVRGRTVVAAVFDEAAYWRDESSAQPDVEVYRAILPALATTNGMLVGISSPYATRGLLHSKYQSAYAKDDPLVLVVKASSKELNPTLDDAIIAQAYADDAEAAAAEWGGSFRGDLALYVQREVVEKCVDWGTTERRPVAGVKYTAFVDPSGGQHDSFALAIGHRQGGAASLDAILEIEAPFDPPVAVERCAALLERFGCLSVIGDNYAAAWVVSEFRRAGIRYAPSEHSRSEIYLNGLPLLTGGSALLLDSKRLVSQLSQLERRTSRTGRDSVDHPRSGSDDVANACMGVLVHLPQPSGKASSFHQLGRMPQVIGGHEKVKRSTRRVAIPAPTRHGAM